ncbi:type VI-B CRISPR-associated RNA-guided ribonuclease Cas13b [Neolewinella lacunae]|uniref:Uncharacterized protein n=1 Tax=Neolewinella lacunae TaxID=1517758 RepID=A0A923PN63_9BACT|nr:type VI-B CRISPR-associated RNA-guided ribonuclease Cas13b [Neolewinella lacunae]MBC6994308.1 hypothetical protein [Neolewinella lacunae]MDN3634935.1 type VI-B CRISPR-associated RNA-guided ribonuclease Cas13b [Neolewinella lacunae]
MIPARPATPVNRKNLHEHPHYFGAFLSIARHNAFMVIKHLSAKYNTSDKDKLKEETLSTAQLFNCLGKKFNKPDITKSVISDLKNYFPLLNYPLFLALEADGGENKNIAFESDLEAIQETFKSILTLLNSLRNHFSHYISSVDYSRFNFSPIEDIYKAAMFRLIDRSKYTKRFDVFEKEHIKHLENKGKNKSEFFPHDLSETPNHENTVAFITCLFLERKYAFPFLSRLASFQTTYINEDPKTAKATRECYTMFCTRLPQPKLESADIMLDMINELGRSPAALYNMLSEKDQQAFHIAQELLPDNLEEYDEEDGVWETEVVLKRHGDRFPYFALRYFDDTEAFPTLRFNISLGKWRTKPAYDKIIYGEKRERILTKPLHTFARLNDFLPVYESAVVVDNRVKIDNRFVGLLREDWLSKQENQETYINEGIEQFSIKYNFGDNVIAFQFIKDIRTVKELLPKLPAPKIKMAHAIISTYDLRGLFLYDYLSKYSTGDPVSSPYIPTDTETFIKDYIERLKRFFSDVKTGSFHALVAKPDQVKNEKLPFVKGDREATKAKRALFNDKQEVIKERKRKLDRILSEKYGLSIHNIPTKLKDYLLAYKTPPYRTRAMAKLKQQHTIVKDLLKAVDKGRSPRVGEQATWLAEDIVFMTPPKIHTVDGVEHPQKLNNAQFRILQESLAYFSTNKLKILNFLREETSILSPNQQESHPFLKSVNFEDQPGILSFYEDYLKAKLKWLDNALRKLRNLDDKAAKREFGHFLPTSINVKPATDLDYTALPIYLPRGLFDRAVVSTLIEGNHFGVQSGDNINQCLEKMLASDSQPFYELDRLHQSIFTDRKAPEEYVEESLYIGKLLEKRRTVLNQKANSGKLGKNKQQEIKNQYNDVTKERKRVLERRQYIKSIQSDDRALWLMAQNRQKQKSEHLEVGFDQLGLRNIKEILTKPVQVSLLIPDTSFRINDELPLIRYGDLRRVAKDRRLENLSYFYKAASQDEIPHETIKLELERYDRRREGFFETIYRFEELVYNKFKAQFPEAPESTKQHYYDHHAYADVAIQHSSDTPFNVFFKEKATQLRNKFYHNEFPWFEWLLPEVSRRKEELYSDRVFDIAEGYYQRMADLISSK